METGGDGDVVLLSMCVSGAKFVPSLKREGQRRVPLYSSSKADIKIVCSSSFFLFTMLRYLFQHRSAAGVVQLCGKIYALGGHNGLSIFDSVEVRHIGTLCKLWGFCYFFWSSVADPFDPYDTYVFGHHGSKSRSISMRYGSKQCCGFDPYRMFLGLLDPDPVPLV